MPQDANKGATFNARVDCGRTAEDYQHYRAGFLEAFFGRLTVYGIGRRGQRILDLGTGTGKIARSFALRGAAIVGLDPAEALC
jgi:2-polyprenyl-3-methyl-5-hydroxy-6-metoxy-1,4-benzoquinol methylase